MRPGWAIQLHAREVAARVGTFFGDDAVSNGAFHEGLNLAGVWRLRRRCSNLREQMVSPTEDSFRNATANTNVAHRRSNLWNARHRSRWQRRRGRVLGAAGVGRRSTARSSAADRRYWNAARTAPGRTPRAREPTCTYRARARKSSGGKPAARFCSFGEPCSMRRDCRAKWTWSRSRKRFALEYERAQQAAEKLAIGLIRRAARGMYAEPAKRLRRVCQQRHRAKSPTDASDARSRCPFDRDDPRRANLCARRGDYGRRGGEQFRRPASTTSTASSGSATRQSASRGFRRHRLRSGDDRHTRLDDRPDVSIDFHARRHRRSPSTKSPRCNTSSSGRLKMPIVLRACIGVGCSAAMHHSGNYSAMFAHLPGLRGDALDAIRRARGYWQGAGRRRSGAGRRTSRALTKKGRCLRALRD